MTDDVLTLAGEFPPASHDDWLAAVEKVLRGRSFDTVLRSTTPDGLVIEPLYTSADAAAVPQYPGAGIGRRASSPAGSTAGWDIRQRHGLAAGAASTNDAVLADLARGVTSIELATAGMDAEAMSQVLDGVYLDLAPLALVSPGDGVVAARMLLDLAASRGVDASALVADLGCDPIGRLADHGVVDGGMPQALAAVAELAVEVAASHRAVRTIRADASAYAHAGATPATELAALLSTGVAYLRQLVDAGLSVDDALDQILLVVTVGNEQFADIAKLRALRLLWARVGEASGATPWSATVQAVTSAGALTSFDPWVNMLRTTLGCFAAAVGGADIITVRPFDSVVGVPDELGLRIARNTQLVLMEESNLHRVIDPAGGSWYVEQLTDQLADAAWARFQDLERAGGVIATLEAGSLQAEIADSAAERAQRVASRRRAVTGVSEFPNIDEQPLERAVHPQLDQSARDPERALPLRRLAEPYEALRLAAAAADTEPTVFLANLGPAAVHTARATWAKNFFEAGGIRAIGNDGFDDDTELAAAFSASGATIAVVCSNDDTYADRAVGAAEALRSAGATHLWLAGKPGDHAAAWSAAGIDSFISLGTDVLAGLQAAHEALGIEPAPSPDPSGFATSGVST